MKNTRFLSVSAMDRLGDELIFNILQRLSAEEVSKVIDVCKRWFSVINQQYFMKTNLIRQQKSDNMLVQIYNEEEDVYESSIFSVQNGQLGHKKAIGYLKDWKIQASCNGLLLVQHSFHLNILRITNPLTKSTLSLPPCIPIMDISSFAFVFVETSQTYHVIYMYDANHPNTSSRQNIECQEVILSYDSSKDQIEGLQWKRLWDGDFLGHTVRCSTNPICLSGAIVVWKLNSRKEFLAWDIGTGSVNSFPLPSTFLEEAAASDDDLEYFLVNKGGTLAFVDYNETRTMVRMHTLCWDTKEWKRHRGISLHGYDNRVGYEVDEVNFISKNDIIMIFATEGHAFQCNSDTSTYIELGELSGKNIVFCCNHVESIVQLKEALSFPL